MRFFLHALHGARTRHRDLRRHVVWVHLFERLRRLQRSRVRRMRSEHANRHEQLRWLWFGVFGK
jgi:hypothetical protein